MSLEESFRVLQDDPSPFFLEGGRVGALLLHGFSGTPREMWRLGEYVHARGITAHAPLLPGHGSTLAQMNRYGWRDWAAGTVSAYEQLALRCDQVVVVGFSLGTLLTLWLAAHYAEIKGIVLCAPALRVADWRLHLTPLVRHFVQSLEKKEPSDLHDPGAEAWLGGFVRYPIPAAAEILALQRRVKRLLPRVKAPVLVVYSAGDRSIHPRSGPETVKRLSKYGEIDTLVLTDSGHAVVADKEWEEVAKATYAFIQRVAPVA